MGRTRRENKKAHSTYVYSVPFTADELTFISWVVANAGGLNREKTRLSISIIDELGLDTAELKEGDYELAGHELHFILDLINDVFNASKMPAIYGKRALQVEDTFNGLMEMEEKDEEEAVED